MMFESGTEISYNRVKDITSKIASKVQSNMHEFNGVYVPADIPKNFPIRCSADNMYLKVDTFIFKKIYPKHISQCVNVALPLNFGKNVSLNLCNVPTTVTEMSPCSITGCPKPTRSS